jgi:superfamily II DNA/RNA helicase
MSFINLNLHEGIIKAVEELGFSTPTPIQQEAIPMILSGCDLRASAQTGTGKTAAFILPALHKLTVPSPIRSQGPRILILVPTRELAMQVATEATKFSKHLPRVKTVCIYGGAPYPVQNRDLSRPFEILVATPGRLIDHMERGRIDFSRLEMMILDEADRMLDMGFIDPVEQIAKATPSTRQTLMFSATLKGSVLDLSNRLLNKPKEINVAHDTTKTENIEQRLHYVDNLSHKHRLLEQLLIGPETNQTIVFTSTKRNADVLVDLLLDMGHRAAPLHGDMNQRQRSRTIENLRKGTVRVLVATDVAARGIDVLTITHVINFDLPSTAEDYVHRIGRTGRAGGTGIAMSFASDKEMHLVRNIERFTGNKITVHVVPGMEPQARDNNRFKDSRFGREPNFNSRRPPSKSRSNSFKSPSNRHQRTR